MTRLPISELALAWVAAILTAAVALYTYLGGFIAPQSVTVDLLGAALILAAIALGAALDVASNGGARWVGLILLTGGTLALAFVAAISFVLFLLPPAALALVATALAYIRRFAGAPQTRSVA